MVKAYRIAFIALSIWAVVSCFIIFSVGAESERRGELVGKYRADSEELDRVSNELAGAVGVAKDSGRSASDLLAEYRRGVAAREAERQARIEGLIGQAGQGGIGAIEIASGIDGDIALARRVEEYSGRVENWIRELQEGIRRENKAP